MHRRARSRRRSAPETLDVEHAQNHPPRAHADPVDQEDGRDGDGHAGRRRARMPERRSARRAGRESGRSRPGSVGRSGRARKTVASELAEGDREGEPSGDCESARDDRQIDFAPHSPRRRAEQRRRLALARVDRAERRRDDPNDERDRDERLNDRNDPRRRSEVEGLGVERDAGSRGPSITAEAPSGSRIEAVEEPRARRVRQRRTRQARRRRARSQSRLTRTTIELTTASTGDEEDARRVAERSVGIERMPASDREVSRSTRTTSGKPEEDRKRHRDWQRRRPSRGACAPAGACPARRAADAGRRQSPFQPHRDPTRSATTHASCTIERTAAARRSNRRTAWL